MSKNQTHAIPTNNNNNNEPKSWHDVYRLFLEIADEVLDAVTDHDEAHKLICRKVDALYAQHEGEHIWDFAYERWYEPCDDDEEVQPNG